ncbi:MAG: Acg family FMN-binding oxidoreductase, partial [Mycobacteriales bacterium]
RQLWLSCGAAAELARLATRMLGYACLLRTGPLPDDADGAADGHEGADQIAARLVVGRRLPPTSQERRLAAAIPRRHTARGPYDDRPVEPAVLASLAEAVQERGCWLRRVDRPGERGELIALLSRAEERELADPAYRRELGDWRRRGAGAPDGFAADASLRWPAERVGDLPLRDFAGSGAAAQALDTAPRVEHDTVVVLGTDSDRPRDWVRAGRALALMLVVATDAGLVAQPLGPVTDVPSTRALLRHDLSVLGHPQLVLRLGYGSAEPEAGRRPVRDVLTSTP